MNIPSYAVTFPATTARKTFFGTRQVLHNPACQICELEIYVLEKKKNEKKKHNPPQKKNKTKKNTQQNHTFSFENYQVLQP